MALRRSISWAAGTIMAAVALTATCGGDESPSAERFCGEIEANLDFITKPELSFVDDVEPLLALYRKIANLAPLAIETEWRQLVTNYETASTVVHDDPESVQRVVMTAYQTEGSAAAVERWLEDYCALSIGPLSTIVDQN